MDTRQAVLDALLPQFNGAPFNRLIGLTLEALEGQHCRARFEMRPELLGNVVHRILHGGVTSSVLDTIGGATATIGAWERMQSLDPAERIRRLANLGTLDMRVDYLKPGRGEWFTVDGRVLRAGNKVIVTRMDMHNNEGELIAVATGTYLY
jgi:uncharacterized protein (TIGR00369 family)